MDQLKQAALSFKKLLNQEYDFIIGRKGVKREFRITFVESDFHHLCGLHKLIDISQVQKKDRTKVFEEILSDDIKMETMFGSGDFSHIASGQNRQSQSEQKCHCTSFVPISCCCSG